MVANPSHHLRPGTCSCIASFPLCAITHVAPLSDMAALCAASRTTRARQRLPEPEPLTPARINPNG